MTHPISQEVQSLAEGLTKAQARALIDAGPRKRGWPQNRIYHAGSPATSSDLRDLGLSERMALTPLGLAVRAHLLKGSTNDQ